MHASHQRCPIKYSNGKRKTQAMSTKCQYKPAISTALSFPFANLPRHASSARTSNIPMPAVTWDGVYAR